MAAGEAAAALGRAAKAVTGSVGAVANAVGSAGRATKVWTRPAVPGARSMRAATFQNMPDYVKVVEVGPRDGLQVRLASFFRFGLWGVGAARSIHPLVLQNEKKVVPAATKVEFIDKLVGTGLSYIEATSFVSSKWVPQVNAFKPHLAARMTCC
jgi:hypothetical protein